MRALLVTTCLVLIGAAGCAVESSTAVRISVHYEGQLELVQVVVERPVGGRKVFVVPEGEAGPAPRTGMSIVLLLPDAWDGQLVQVTTDGAVAGSLARSAAPRCLVVARGRVVETAITLEPLSRRPAAGWPRCLAAAHNDRGADRDRDLRPAPDTRMAGSDSAAPARDAAARDVKVDRTTSALGCASHNECKAKDPTAPCCCPMPLGDAGTLTFCYSACLWSVPICF